MLSGPGGRVAAFSTPFTLVPPCQKLIGRLYEVVRDNLGTGHGPEPSRGFAPSLSPTGRAAGAAEATA